MLDVAIACKSFATASGDSLLAVSDLAFTVPEGGFACLVGPSGCGKSTTLRIVLGLDHDFEGRVATPPGRVAAVFQEPRLLPWRTVEANLRLALPAEASAKDLPGLLAELGIAGTEKFYPRELSLGMARRAALARAFAVDPALLVLDEPFVSLDDATAERLRMLLIEVWQARRTTALMVTHDLAEAALLADRIILLSPRPATIRGIVDIAEPRGRRDSAAIAAEILSRFPPMG